MSEIKIAVIGGGSSYTPELIDGFIKRHKTLPVKEIWLCDIESGKEKLEIVTALASRMVEHAGLPIQVKSTLNRQDALVDADFVLTQLRVGGLEARAKDERIPLKYGLIGQETTGAGGFAKGLRTIPVILDICRDMERLCKDAWLINFTNPAGMVTEAVLRHTSIKTMGLCNVPIGMKKNVAKMLDVDSNRLFIEFAGLNHLVWGKRIWLDGKRVDDQVFDLIANGESMTMKNIPDLKWDGDFLKTLKMLPCPYHRYFYLTKEMLRDEYEASQDGRTRAEAVMEIEKSLFEKYKDVSLKEKPVELEQRGGAWYSDAAVSLIQSIHGDYRDIHTVNIRNGGTIQELPSDAVVEVNALVGKHGTLPLSVDNMSIHALGLMQSVKAYEILTVDSVIKKDRTLAIQALAVHPLVDSVETAQELFEDIVRENQRYLAYFENEEING